MWTRGLLAGLSVASQIPSVEIVGRLRFHPHWKQRATRREQMESGPILTCCLVSCLLPAMWTVLLPQWVFCVRICFVSCVASSVHVALEGLGMFSLSKNSTAKICLRVENAWKSNNWTLNKNAATKAIESGTCQSNTFELRLLTGSEKHKNAISRLPSKRTTRPWIPSPSSNALHLPQLRLTTIIWEENEFYSYSKSWQGSPWLYHGETFRALGGTVTRRPAALRCYGPTWRNNSHKRLEKVGNIEILFWDVNISYCPWTVIFWMQNTESLGIGISVPTGEMLTSVLALRNCQTNFAQNVCKTFGGICFALYCI